MHASGTQSRAEAAKAAQTGSLSNRARLVRVSPRKERRSRRRTQEWTHVRVPSLARC